MKTLKIVLGSLLMLCVTTQISVAQTYQLNNSSSTLEVEGTSNIHDWELTAEDQQGKLIAELDDGQLVEISKLDFIVKAESLESGKSGMNKNTNKALNTDKYSQIVYKLTKVINIDCTTQDKCKVNTIGDLTIAGTTKPINITFDAQVTESQILLTGNKTLNMTEYGIEPPNALFGTITTGEKVNIKFQSYFKK